jgi:hypothetical protein
LSSSHLLEERNLFHQRFQDNRISSTNLTQSQQDNDLSLRKLE